MLISCFVFSGKRESAWFYYNAFTLYLQSLLTCMVSVHSIMVRIARVAMGFNVYAVVDSKDGYYGARCRYAKKKRREERYEDYG